MVGALDIAYTLSVPKFTDCPGRFLWLLGSPRRWKLGRPPDCRWVTGSEKYNCKYGAYRSEGLHHKSRFKTEKKYYLTAGYQQSLVIIEHKSIGHLYLIFSSPMNKSSSNLVGHIDAWLFKVAIIQELRLSRKESHHAAVECRKISIIRTIYSQNLELV